jgi:dTDP-glucose pyrophosphorylase
MVRKELQKAVESLIVSPDAPISDAIAAIEVGQAQIALVADENLKLLGTVTDGDVRRALIRGESLSLPVESIMQREFRWLPASATEQFALDIMNRESLRQIPLLDDRGRVLKIFLIDNLTRPKDYQNTVLIMAGGKGERLYPLTQHCPKPMLKIGDRPLLQIVIEQCLESGFRNFCLSVNHLKEQIKDYFGDGSRWGIRINYLEEDKPLGTAGALGLLKEIAPGPILVINGDVLTRVNFGQLATFHEECGVSVTVCVREHLVEVPYGVVRTDKHRVLGIEEKPVFSQYISAGIYLVNQEILRLVPQNERLDMPQLLDEVLRKRLTIGAFPLHEYWLDVGLPENLEKAHGDWT